MSSSSSAITSSKQSQRPHTLHLDTTNNGSSSAAARPPTPRPSSLLSPRPSSSASAAAGGSGQNQACAACKYQRRKCNPDCPLARYFPADQQRRFLNAHRLFGVSNIQKTLRRINPEYGPEAMRALIFQSEARAMDPVYGCVGIISKLEQQIQVARAQLDALHHQIAIYRQAAAGGDPLADPAAALAMEALYGGGADQQAAGAGFVFQQDPQQQQLYNNDDENAAFTAVGDQDEQAGLPLCDYFCDNGAPGDEATTSHHASVHGGSEYCYSEASLKPTAGSPGMTTLGEQLEQHCQIEAAPFVDAFDVKPQDLPMTMRMEQHHSNGGSGGSGEPREEKVAASVIKYDHDQKMAEPAPAASKCHLELGFNSF